MVLRSEVRLWFWYWCSYIYRCSLSSLRQWTFLTQSWSNVTKN